jgi:aminopeptidase N
MALTMLCLAAQRRRHVWPGKAYQRFKDAGNMTDRFNALAPWWPAATRWPSEALARFHAMFKDEPLVLDKWFALQAGAPDRGGNVLPLVRQLMTAPRLQPEATPTARAA